MDKSAQEPIRFQYSLIVNISLMDWHLNLVHINRHEPKQQVLLMDFLKKILFQGKQAILGLKMMHSHNFGLMQRVFFDILHNERGREAGENYIKVAHVVNLKLFFTD